MPAHHSVGSSASELFHSLELRLYGLEKRDCYSARVDSAKGLAPSCSWIV